MPPTCSRRLFLGWFGTGLLSSCAGTAPVSSAGPDWVLVRQRGFLRAAADPLVGAPYFFKRAGEYAGFEWEILSALCRQLGVGLEVTPIAWPEQVGALVAQKVDLLFNGHELPPATAEDAPRLPYEPTRPYYLSSQQILYTGAQESAPETLVALAGRRVGVIDQSGGWALVSAYNRKNVVPIGIVGFRSLQDLLAQLEGGGLDVALIEAPVATWQVMQHQNWRRLGPGWLPVALAGLVRTQDQSTREQLDLAMGELVAAGQLQAILRRWGLWSELQNRLVV
ncbi:substrate-binding periplasmic protein [Gloeobacter morelensis]|uniref:Amino acid ABC transporter substrate-binding protein n=1 Tax=Gloeobacter morelensis MG652769 TaxID=2781736 RepID=A0ABY3PQP3_9CYAN|nr:transporter substrate-binding domain-containing protein [Gloeobacter morelensis]UFP96028.1 amino acid ABC transporter substrate-binding protein [Gloeobacter morelensis MG652769]